MKVCDRHRDRPAVDTIHYKADDSYVDLCDECKFAIGEALAAPVEPKRRGRPPKELPVN